MTNKTYFGFSGLSHDASLSVVKNNKLVYASHSERYSGVKNEFNPQPNQVKEALSLFGEPDEIFWFENPVLKRLRYLKSGMWPEALSFKNSPILSLTPLFGKLVVPKITSHHGSHAASVYFTRPKHWGTSQVDVFCFDAIGEFETVTQWVGLGTELIKRRSVKYPSSVGLFYSAVTQYLGFKPNEEEFITMGYAALGKVNSDLSDLFSKNMLGENYHRGLSVDMIKHLKHYSCVDIAASAQNAVENWLIRFIINNSTSDYMCLAGGVALNCVANTRIANTTGYKDIWILPNPGDAGSSLGSILSHTKQWLDFDSAFLGTDIPKHTGDTEIVSYLVENKVCGLARGRAEWGPRAFGNRALLADPRDVKNKDLVNNVKNRQLFRPFAPVVLKQFAQEYFELPPNVSDFQYMQYAVKCKLPNLVPACVHVDGTSRVQVVDLDHELYPLLYSWYLETSCPCLLLTSLNVKGKPMVNNRKDADNFEYKYGIKVFS
jgi:carbamoyltransferase